MSEHFDKLKRDGNVAVLYSPGYGAGWYTWNDTHQLAEGLLFDREIVEQVLAGDNVAAVAIAMKKYPDAYFGGAENLEVEWVREGSRFMIEEYDGNECVTVIGPDFGHRA